MKYRLLENYRNEDWMYKQRFRFSEKFSSHNETVFTKRFPVWRQGDNITLEAQIRITLETGEVSVDVYDVSFRGRYAPFYLKPSYYNDLLAKIDERINAELDKCRIITKEGTE